MENNNLNEEVRYNIIADGERRIIELACYNQEHKNGGPIIELSDDKNALEFDINNLDDVIGAMLKLRQRLVPFLNADDFAKNEALLRAKGLGSWCDLFKSYHQKNAVYLKAGGHDLEVNNGEEQIAEEKLSTERYHADLLEVDKPTKADLGY